MIINSEILNEVIQLSEDLSEYNEYVDEPLTLKKYLIQELNYSEEEAEEISKFYNIIMNYS